MNNTKIQFHGTRIQGPHYVKPRQGEKIGEAADVSSAEWFPTLTRARRAAQRGDIIVRQDDKCTVGIK